MAALFLFGSLANGCDIAGDFDKLGKPKNAGKFPDSIIYFESIKQFASTLSASKPSLLKYLSQVAGEPVTKVTLELGPKKKELQRDLRLLKFGLRGTGRHGKKVYLKVSYEVMRMEL